MGLKLTKEDMRRLRASGATIRDRGKPVPDVKFSREQLDQLRQTAATRRAPEPASIQSPEIDMEAICDTIHEAVSHSFAQQENSLHKAHKAPTYHFEIKRDERGFIQSIHATPDE